MTSHLTNAQIRSWMADELSADFAAEVEDHLANCDLCSRMLDGLNDTNGDVGFIERVRDLLLEEEPGTDAGTVVATASQAQFSRAGYAEKGAGGQPPIRGDENLMFGVTAVQMSLIDATQFSQACTLCLARPNETLDAILVSEGWISEADRQRLRDEVDRQVAQNTAAPVAGSDALSPPSGASGRTGGSVPAAGHDQRIKRLSVHSSGAIGRVWLARDLMLDRDIALKELLPERAKSPSLRARFLREAQITAQLTHPGTVHVYDYVGDAERPYYTMKFVKGRTLTEVIAEFHGGGKWGMASRPGLLRLLNHFVSICQTVAYAHSKGVLHRDLKGDNVVVGDFGEVVVLDWGLAKRQESSDDSPRGESSEKVAPDGLTVPGEAMGTPAFMSPEQAEGRLEEIDERTDVYGLAAMLYEILTGDPPFTGKSVTQVLADVIESQPIPPRRRKPGVPAGLEKICLAGLSKDREDRPQSVVEFTSSVEDWVMRQAEQKQSAKTRERFFELSHDLLGILDPGAGIREINPAWQLALGWTAQELSHMSLWDLVDPAEHETLKKNLARLRGGEAIVSVEHRCACRDGRWKWVSWNATWLSQEQAIYVVGRDIELLKQAEQKYQGLLDSAPDAMVVTDTSRRIRLVNTQTESMFEYGRKELIDQPIEVLIPQRFHQRHPQAFANYVETPKVRPMGTGLQLWGRRKSGEEFAVEIRLSCVDTPDGRLVSSVIREKGSP